VIQKNPRHLDAEDDTTLDAGDRVTWHPRSADQTLRAEGMPCRAGSTGTPVLGSGINLTHLFTAKCVHLVLPARPGIVNKIYPSRGPDEVRTTSPGRRRRNPGSRR